MPGPCLDCDAVACLGDLADLDAHVGQYAGLFAGVERVVDALLHRREQGFRRIVEPEQVAVLGKELGNGDVALALREIDGGRARARLGRGGGTALARRRRGLRLGCGLWFRGSSRLARARLRLARRRLEGKRLLVRHEDPPCVTIAAAAGARKRERRGEADRGLAQVLEAGASEVADEAHAPRAQHVDDGGDDLVLVVRDLAQNANQLEQRARMRLERRDRLRADGGGTHEFLPPSQQQESMKRATAPGAGQKR
jgi:hypothetical protein